MRFIKIGFVLLLMGIPANVAYGGSDASQYGNTHTATAFRTGRLLVLSVRQRQGSKSKRGRGKETTRPPKLSAEEIEVNLSKARPEKTWLVYECTTISEYRWPKGSIILYAFEPNVPESWRIEFRDMAKYYNELGANFELREDTLETASYVIEAKPLWNRTGEKLGVTARTATADTINKVSTSPGSKIIASARTVINTNYPFFIWLLEYDKWDLRTTLVHEIGHLLGLGHSPCRASPMFDPLGPFERHDKITEYERKGLLELYGTRPVVLNHARR